MVFIDTLKGHFSNIYTVLNINKYEIVNVTLLLTSMVSWSY